MIDPEHVAMRRKSSGMTQHDLANNAGISQSLVAKIERGLVKPSYDVMKRIDETLRAPSTTTTAGQIAQHRPICCTPNDSLKDVIALMAKHQFSQLPVQDDFIVGLVTENDVFRGICDGKTHVKAIMQPPPPIVHASTTEDVVLSLLDHIPIILVQDGRRYSVLTKADIFRKYRQKI